MLASPSRHSPDCGYYAGRAWRLPTGRSYAGGKTPETSGSPLLAMAAMLIYGIMADVCFTGGWILELLSRRLWRRSLQRRCSFIRSDYVRINDRYMKVFEAIEEIHIVSPLHCSNCRGFDFDKIIEGDSWTLRCGSCGHIERSGLVVPAPGSHPPASAARAEVAVKPYTAPADLSSVSLGAVLELKDECGTLRRMQVLDAGQYFAARRADPNGNFVTIDSPMGVALAGRHVGDLIRVELPAGSKIFTLVSLQYGAGP